MLPSAVRGSPLAPSSESARKSQKLNSALKPPIPHLIGYYRVRAALGMRIVGYLFMNDDGH